MTGSRAPHRPDAPERDVVSARDLPGRPVTAISRREDGQNVAVGPGARRGDNFTTRVAPQISNLARSAKTGITGAFGRRLPPAAVLRAPLGRPHRRAARSRSSAILIYHVVTRATATCAAERPESFAAPRKRSGTLPRTSLSGARSTKTLDMLLLGPSRRPHAPVDWTGRADAPTRLDLRPPGPRTLTRPTWPEDAAVATGTIARPPPRLNYVHASSARRGF